MPDGHGAGKRLPSLAPDELGPGRQEDSKLPCGAAASTLLQGADDPVCPTEVFIEVRGTCHGQAAGLERQ